MYGYIYKTVNLVNNKIYIGQHKSEVFDTKYFGSGKILRQAILKEGIENFKCEVLEWGSSAEDLNNKEIYWISKYNSCDPAIGYNLSKGGFVPRLVGEHNGFYGKHHTEESRAKMSIKRKGRPGTPHTMSDEAKRKISKKNKGRIVSKESVIKRDLTIKSRGGYGRWVTDEYRKKLSDIAKSKNYTHCKGRMWINNDIESKMIYPEEFDEYSCNGWKKGRLPVTQEFREKCSNNNKGRNAHNKNKLAIHKNGKVKFVHENELSTYLSDNWELGNLPVSNEARLIISKSRKGRIWINNGSVQKTIFPEDIEYYPNWKRGMLPKKTYN